MGWLRYFVPGLLLPTFTWPHQVLRFVDLASSILPAPHLYPLNVRRAIGFFHYSLRSFSMHYCHRCGIPFENQVVALPCGLVLK